MLPEKAASLSSVESRLKNALTFVVTKMIDIGIWPATPEAVDMFVTNVFEHLISVFLFPYLNNWGIFIPHTKFKLDIVFYIYEFVQSNKKSVYGRFIAYVLGKIETDICFSILGEKINITLNLEQLLGCKAMTVHKLITKFDSLGIPLAKKKKLTAAIRDDNLYSPDGVKLSSQSKIINALRWQISDDSCFRICNNEVLDSTCRAKRIPVDYQQFIGSNNCSIIDDTICSIDHGDVLASSYRICKDTPKTASAKKTRKQLDGKLCNVLIHIQLMSMMSIIDYQC